MIVMVTGHRPQRLRGQEKEVSAAVGELLDQLKPDKAISGMAAGTDQIFAMEAIDRDIPLYCYFPYPRQHYHPQEEYIIERSAGCRNICNKYSKESYMIRDKAMVDDSDIVIAVWDGIEQGGTWNTIDYARKRGKEIKYIMINYLMTNYK